MMSKAYELCAINWEKQQLLFVRILSHSPFSLKIRLLLSCGYREGTSHMRVLCPMSGDKGGGKSK